MSYVEDAPARAVSSAQAEVYVEILWLEGPNTSDGDWCDITPYVTAWEAGHGRDYELDEFNAGGGTVTVETFDRLFDREYTSGPWYPWLLPNRQIRIYEVWDGTRLPIGRGYITDYGDTIEADAKFTTTITWADGFERGEHVKLPSSFYELVVAADRPDHWWHLDEEAGTVAVDNGYASATTPGTYHGSSTLGEAEIVPYDGGRSSVTVAPGAGIAVPAGAIPASSEWSFEVWFLQETIATAPSRMLLSVGSSHTAGAYMLVGGTTGGITGQVSFAFGGGAAFVTSADTYDDGVVHHAVGTVSISGGVTTVELMVDGVSQGTDTTGLVNIGGPVLIGGDCIALGSTIAGGTTPIDGKIAEVAVYGRALTEAEALDHYTAGSTAYSGDDTGARLTRICDAIGWPANLRDIGTGVSTVGAHDLSGESFAEYVRLMGSTELGQTYFDADGKLVHRSRHSLFLDTRSKVSQATFGDVSSDATCRAVEDGIVLRRDNRQIRNPVRAARRDGITARALDAELVDYYGDNGYDAPESVDADDNVMPDRAGYILERYKRPATRLEELTFEPASDPDVLWPQVGRKVGDRITVKRNPGAAGQSVKARDLGGGNTITTEQIIQRISHSGSQHTRSTTYVASPAETVVPLILDDTTFGLLDAATLAY